MLDVALIVPLESDQIGWLEPAVRRSQSPARFRAVKARHLLEEYVGRPLHEREDVPEWVGPQGIHAQRSAGAIVLASSLERAGLRWHVIDPGERRLAYWREKLAALRARRPRLVAINTTFIMEFSYLRMLCALVRQELPGARLALGGYLYSTDAKRFLAADADIMCVGEGESRIVQIARAVRDGFSLEKIPGLYVRRPDGSLVYTGNAEPLDLESVPPPDWSLSLRMDPPIDPERDLRFNVETQRGCAFKCEFCTYRTLAALTETSIERAVDVILAQARYRPGRTWLVDATATFPRERWRAILEGILARGGSPHPISTHARVSDLDDEICALMARANVRHVFIGQESGEQRMLNAMRKGTRVDQVGPAFAALARHGLVATLGFIHGFPGEDMASIEASRRMMESLNVEGNPDPVAIVVHVEVFGAQDLASVSQREQLRGYTHQYGYDLPITSERAADETLLTFMRLARLPHAAVTGFGLCGWLEELIWQFAVRGRGRDAFRWFKAYDRGMGLILERELEGKPLPDAEMRRVREALLAGYPEARRALPAWRRLADRGLHRVIWRLTDEWRREERSGVGPLTRLLLASDAWKATHRLGPAAHACLHGALPSMGSLESVEVAEATVAREALARDLIALGIATGKHKRSPAPRIEPAAG